MTTGMETKGGDISYLEKRDMSRSEDLTKSQDSNSNSSASSGGGTLSPPLQLTPEQEKKLYRKVDVRLMPILSLLYLLSTMDRGNIGNANILGLSKQLDLVGNRFNIVLTMFVIPYCLCEIPANLVIKKIRPSRWLPGLIVTWGTVTTLTGIVKTYPQLIGVRICLGVTEAGLFPGVLYYLTLWYPRHMLLYRISLFFGAASVGGAFSGLFAYGISFMSGTAGLLGWSWIFILEGILTVIAGIFSAFVIIDFPADAKFLTSPERAYVIWKKKYDNSSVGEAENFDKKYIWAVFKDWQVYLHLLVYMSVSAPLNGISIFLPSIINGIGFGVVQTQLLTVPCYIFATILLLIFAHYSDTLRLRSPFILSGLTMTLIGFAIQISPASRGAKYFGIFLCVGGSFSAFPATVAWLGNNLAGQYKRAVGMPLQIGVGNFSAIIAYNIYRRRDAPRYILGHSIEIMFICIGYTVIPIIVLLYKRINKERDQIMARGKEAGTPQFTVEQLREMGDKAPDFRYML